MGLETGSLRYDLSVPFKFYDADKGADDNASHLLLLEPGYKQLKPALRIQQMVTRVFTELSASQPSAGVEVKPIHQQDTTAMESTGMADALEVGLLMSETIDIGEFVELWIPIATGGCVLIDGKQAMTTVHIERVHPNDILSAAVRWAAFFGMPSALTSAGLGEPSESRTPQMDQSGT